MEKGWIKIFSSGYSHQAEMMKAVLKSNEIDSIIINRQDSSYLTFGEVELYVNQLDAVLANQIILRNSLE
jgi:hypothetical protein